MAEQVEKSIEVNVPVSTAYSHWKQFESFPRFMEGIEEVRPLGGDRYHWRASIAGKEEEWEGQMTEDVPEQRISWRAVSGKENAGTVIFEPVAQSRTRVHLQMIYEPEGFMENVGDMLGMVDRRVEGDLERFKEWVEGSPGGSLAEDTGMGDRPARGSYVDPTDDPELRDPDRRRGL